MRRTKLPAVNVAGLPTISGSWEYFCFRRAVEACASWRVGVCVSVSFCPLPRRDLVLQVSTMLRRVAGCVRRQGKTASYGSVRYLAYVWCYRKTDYARKPLDQTDVRKLLNFTRPKMLCFVC